MKGPRQGVVTERVSFCDGGSHPLLPSRRQFPFVFDSIHTDLENDMAALIIIKKSMFPFPSQFVESPRTKTRPQPKIPVCCSKGRPAQVTRIANFDPWYIAKEPADHGGSIRRTPLGQPADEVVREAHQHYGEDRAMKVTHTRDPEAHHGLQENRRRPCDVASKVNRSGHYDKGVRARRKTTHGTNCYDKT